MARERPAREAVPGGGGRSRLRPRPARAPAVPAARAVGRRVAGERGRLDPRGGRRGVRRQRAAAGGAGPERGSGGRRGGRAHQARAGVRRACRASEGAARGRRAVKGAAAPRVVTFGELLLRLSPPDEERLLASPELRTFWGGAEANVAVGLSHLGVRCDYVTRVPANPIGDAGIDALRHEGVGTEWIQRGGERMGLYFVEPGRDLRTMRVVYDRAGSAFARLDPASLDWSAVLAGAEHFHASGITPALGERPAAALADAVACARAQGTPVSLDLNYRAALWGGRDPR